MNPNQQWRTKLPRKYRKRREGARYDPVLALYDRYCGILRRNRWTPLEGTTSEVLLSGWIERRAELQHLRTLRRGTEHR